MSKHSVIVKLICTEDRSDELETALATLVEASNEEAGLEIYSVHRDADNVYWFFEMYTDDDAVAAHGKSDSMRAAMADVGALLAAPPEVHRLTPVAAKGIEI